MKPSTQLYLDLIKSNKGMKDITLVLTSDEMMDLVAYVSEDSYDEFHIEQDGVYHYVSSLIFGFYIEGIYSSNGEIKLNSTDVLYLPKYLPLEVKNELINGEYQELIYL